MSTQTATAADAQLILQLYDLRREAEMRKARNYCAADFNPQSFDEFYKIAMAYSSPENTYLRMVFSYWDMACSLVLNGALNERLFLENAHEMFMIYVKLKPFLAQSRQVFDSPDFFANIEKMAEGSEFGRERVRMFQQRIAKWMENMRAAKAESAAGSSAKAA